MESFVPRSALVSTLWIEIIELIKRFYAPSAALESKCRPCILCQTIWWQEKKLKPKFTHYTSKWSVWRTILITLFFPVCNEIPLKLQWPGLWYLRLGFIQIARYLFHQQKYYQKTYWLTRRRTNGCRKWKPSLDMQGNMFHRIYSSESIRFLRTEHWS